jgi:diguanylate cyclase (GGDEF)-like protein/PAS domain S-box-containing protein
MDDFFDALSVNCAQCSEATAVLIRQNRGTQKMSGMEFNFAANLMQFLVVPTFVLDNKGKVLIWNKACERLTGVAAADIIGTTEHWRAFYEEPRACLADLIVQNRLAEIDALYVVHDDPTGQAYGVHAENWCVMPNQGKQLYLAIDAGPIFDHAGQLVAVVETLRDITVQKRAQTALEGLAYLDGLTGIYNRRAFDEKLEMEWERSSRDQTNLALIMIDVDFFKRYNDSYGHQMGDACLKQIATALSTVVARPQDAVARYGGEEFAVILPGCDQAGILIVGERIREHIAELKIPHHANEASEYATVSMGASFCVATPGADMSELVALADAALYQAKTTGRDRLAFQLPGAAV